MAKKYLDYDGLLYFWQKLKTYFVKQESGKGLSTNDYTTAEKNKLAGIASGAEVNQNAFSSVKVGSTTIAADSKTDTVELVAGTNITLTADATNDKVTIATGVTASSTTPKMDGTAAVGSETAYARGDHVHPSDTSRVPTTRTVNGHALSSDVTVTKSDVGLGNVDNTADANKSVASAAALTATRLINGIKFDGTANIGNLGVCSTAAATAEKGVVCPYFSLTDGSVVFVRFVNTNTASVSSVKLNVNSTGAFNIVYRGGLLPSAGTLAAMRIYCFVYLTLNGVSAYHLVGDLDTNTTYTNASLGNGYGVCATDADVAAKVVTLSGYSLAVGGIVAVQFTNGTDAIADGVTMNINGKGAKPVYWTHETPLTTHSIYPMDIAMFVYTGTAYQLINVQSHTLLSLETEQLSDGKTQVSLLRTHPDGTGDKTRISYVNLPVVPSSYVGAANGVAPLNASSKIDSAYLPSFVDDVVEAYARSGQTALSSAWLATGSATGTVITPETGKIYILMADSGDYAANTQFRWSGTTYVKLNDGGVSSITNSEIDTIVAS